MSIELHPNLPVRGNPRLFHNVHMDSGRSARASGSPLSLSWSWRSQHAISVSLDYVIVFLEAVFL